MRSSSQLSAKADLLRRLRPKLPMNSLHLPEAIYRPDLLPCPPLLVQPPTTEEDVPVGPAENQLQLPLPVPVGEDHQLATTDCGGDGDLYLDDDPYLDECLPLALMPVLYTEGFPSMVDGRSFWSMLDFEPEDAYYAFEDYLALKSEGARQLASLHENYTPIDLLEYFYLYYWDYRSKAYDMFRIAAFRKLKEERALETEDDHYLKSKELFTRCMEFIQGDDFWEQVTPKVAIDLLRLITQLQRVSAGVPAMSPPDSLLKGSNGALPQGAQLDVIFRQLASGTPVETMAGELATRAGANIRAEEVLDSALKDPKTAFLAQELIIRMSTGVATDLDQFDLTKLEA